MFKDEILDNERRRKIYAAIAASPGIYLRELQRSLDMPLTTLEYHLGYMVRKKIVYTESEAHHRRYYSEPLGVEDRKALTALRQRRMREIVLIVLMNKKAKFQFLLDSMKLPRSTLSLYLKHLMDRDILIREKIGYENVYTLKDEDRIARVLIAYKTSLVDLLVDKALGIWMETQFRKKEEKQSI